MDLPAGLVNVLDILLSEIGEVIDSSNLADIFGVVAASDCHHALLDSPEEEDASLVHAKTSSNALENRNEWSALVTKDWCQWAIRLRHDPVLLLQFKERLELREEVWVELEFYSQPSIA